MLYVHYLFSAWKTKKVSRKPSARHCIGSSSVRNARLTRLCIILVVASPLKLNGSISSWSMIMPHRFAHYKYVLFAIKLLTAAPASELSLEFIFIDGFCSANVSWIRTHCCIVRRIYYTSMDCFRCGSPCAENKGSGRGIQCRKIDTGAFVCLARCPGKIKLN